MSTERPGAKRLTASERESLLRLNVAFEIMALDVMEPLAERMRMIPGAMALTLMLSFARALAMQRVMPMTPVFITP